VRALAGGRDFGSSPFNRAVLAKRSPGSALKPLIFAAGLELGYFKTDSMLEDKPIKIISGGKVWKPQNYDRKYLGPITYRDALVFSRNIPAIEVLQKIGPAQFAEFAGKMGIESGMTLVPSLALGTSEVTPLEMTASYAPLANGGNSVEPIFVHWVTDLSGRVIKENKPELVQVISSATASQMTGLLQDAVDRGTGRNVRKLGYAGFAAGKTGTSDYFNDAWFIGYTSEILCGVWLGNDKPTSLGNTASELAVPVWTEFVKSIPVVPPPAAAVSEPVKKSSGGIKGFFKRLFGK
jgi:penicillin-binding protein 1A